jgi:hypothetical protein
MSVTRDGRSAELSLTPPRRNPPARIVLHLDQWSGQHGTMELPLGKRVRQTITLTP